MDTDAKWIWKNGENRGNTWMCFVKRFDSEHGRHIESRVVRRTAYNDVKVHSGDKTFGHGI